MSDAAQDGYCGKNRKRHKNGFCLFKPAVPFRDFSPPALTLQKNPQSKGPHFTYFHFLLHIVLRRNFYSNPFKTLSLPFHLGVEELETEKRKTWDSKRSRWPTPSLRWTVRFRSPYFSLICLMDYVSMLIICLHGSGLFLIILVYGFCVYVCV